MTTTPTSGAADLPEALRRSTAADGKTELFNLPGYPLMVRAVDFNRIHTESEMRRTALLDEMQKTALAAGQAPKAAPGEQNTVPAEWLEQAYREGWAACRDAEITGEEEEDWAFGNSTANSRMIDAQQAAPQQEAQEPSHRETVDVVGVRSNGEHVNLEKIAMPPRMKAREIAIEQFGSFKDDDGSDAEMCFGALEYFLEWLIQQGWSKAPQPAPAPLSEREAFEVAWEKLHGKRPVLWSHMFAEHKMETPSHSEGKYFARDEQAAWKLWQAKAALAAQGGKDA